MQPVNSSGLPTARLRRPPAACTIITRNYLSHARVLAASYLRHEPGGRFYLLVLDSLPDGVSAGPNVQVVRPEELDTVDVFAMCFKYDIVELCTAVKPGLLSLLMNGYGEEAVIYFDPDILIMRPLDELSEVLSSSSIVLIPHLLKPIPLDGHRPSEQDILIAGAYNLGFVALRKSGETEEFLSWWNERLQDGCRVDVPNGLFVDQRWVDLIPGFFPSTSIFRDETYDVAYWNLHSRPLGRSKEQFLVNGRPLAFFHFSGYDPAKSGTLSRHQNRIKVKSGTPLAQLLSSYSDLHMKNGYQTTSKWGYGFSHFDNGIAVNQTLRQLYLGCDSERRGAFGNPFQVSGSGSFLTWAVEPAKDGISPFVWHIYRIRSDLAKVFPKIRGRDRMAFLNWARTSGASEMGYDPRLVKADSSPIKMVNGENRKMVLKSAFDSETPSVAGEQTKGVNVCGYLRNETGLGAVARGYVGALRSLKVPLALRDVSILSPNRSEDPTLTSFDATHPHDVNLICVNADQHFVLMSHLGEAFFRNRYNIGVWFWELSRFPEEWQDRFGYYDEIWAASSFIANALAPLSPVPVVHMPPVLTTRPGSREHGRRHLGVSPEEFVSLFIFDFASHFERKNPLGLIEAFKQAFSPSDASRLVIKCVNQDRNKAGFAAMKAAAEGHQISIHTGYWTADEMRDLMAACDAYVSLHRSEGMGLPIADAMALGKPVIATDWSGNADFMNISNSFPVRYDLIEIGDDVGPYRAGELWADPDVDHAAELMRFVFDHRDEAAIRGQAAKREIEANYSEERVAAMIRQRLEIVGLGHRAGRRRGRVDHLDYLGQTECTSEITLSDGRPPARLKAPIVPPMDTDSSLHGLLGRWGKRLVSFLLSYHTYYQRNVNLSFSAFMRDLSANQERLADTLDEVLARMEAMEKRDNDKAGCAKLIVNGASPSGDDECRTS